MNNVADFLTQYFEGIELAPALFYDCKNGIRFEISESVFYDEPGFLKQAFERSNALFDAVFADEDKILLVTNVYTNSTNDFLRRTKLNVYPKYIENKSLLHNMKFETNPNLHGDEDLMTHRFVLSCEKSDIRYRKLLRAICHEDFRHSSTIMKNQQGSGYDIFFINITKNMIFHLYDDRGCDVVAADRESIRYLYERYNEWILDYDRETIDAKFR
ncbi:hypothetical protein CSV79_15000 [Sporosarcina sp. P13]|uniref:DUF3885 domain-containing protein n=1 Tax=Sporosarcina sp. P13 TaxID=2048263 RepID=UPI000C166FA2|nr:DUF3885 domain-containing protein [Sporosarcina sp. P13]PIC62843.1 hypothetical protein CSV79_15000 [Sporosarcina sp. P13]